MKTQAEAEAARLLKGTYPYRLRLWVIPYTAKAHTAAER